MSLYQIKRSTELTSLAKYNWYTLCEYKGKKEFWTKDKANWALHVLEKPEKLRYFETPYNSPFSKSTNIKSEIGILTGNVKFDRPLRKMRSLSGFQYTTRHPVTKGLKCRLSARHEYITSLL